MNVQIIEIKKRVLSLLESNPEYVHKPWSETAKILNIDYRTAKKIIEQYKIDNRITEQTTSNETQTTSYSASLIPEHLILTFEEYCEKFHIPISQVTSSKFVNHQGQAAWNVVVDHTQISETHLNEYFDKLKNILLKKVQPVNILQKELDSDCAYCFWTSDKHVGASNSENALFGNVYNAKVFRDRLFSSLEDYQEEAKARGGRFDKVFIGDLGDSLDGWDAKTTRKGSNHTLRQDMNNRESFDVYSRVMIEFVEALVSLDLANSYEYVAVTNDNHSSDFGYISNRAVEIYLNVRFPEIKTTLFSKFMGVLDYGMHSIIMCHGKDDEYMKHGLPLNLDPKAEKFIDSFIDREKLNDKIVHFVKGDLHQSSLNYGSKFSYRNVMSLYGSSDYTQIVYGPNPAGISIDIIYKNKNKVSRYDIICD